MPTWPASLPQLPLIGATASDEDSVSRTAMDTGPATRRSRFTATVQRHNFPVIFTGAQRVTFDTFYRTTLKRGSLSFTWIDTIDDASATLAFRAPPQWVAVAGEADTTKRLWRANLDLEIQP